jgi:uncharacterized protein YbjQ (UPF0145 family)
MSCDNGISRVVATARCTRTAANMRAPEFIRKWGTRMTTEILISNLDYYPGRRIVRHLGMVQGNTVRAKHVGKDLLASLKNIVGGELTGYTELLQESRTEATNRLLQAAQSIGANAVLNVRYQTTSIAQGAAEIMAYGTAVVLE